MGIEPVPVDGIATGEMDLPDTFQRQRRQDVVDRLSPVQLVAPEIVHVQQDAAVRPFRDLGVELTVGHLAWQWFEIVGSDLERQWPADSCLQLPDVSHAGFDGFPRLEWRHISEEHTYELTSLMGT